MPDRAPVGPAPAALRTPVLVAGLCGQSAAVLSGVLPAVLLPVTALALVLCARLAAGVPPARAEQVRRVATALALVGSALGATRLGEGGPADGLRGVLGPLLVGVQIAQSLTWQARRDLQTGLVVAVGLLVLAASYAPDLVVGLPLLAGWAAGLLALTRLVEAQGAAAADVVVGPVGPVGRGPTGPAWAATGLALAAGLVAFLLVPVPESGGINSRLAAGTGQAATSPRAGGLTGDSVDTSVRGELTDRPIAEVPAGSPALWRQRAFTSWDGRTWSSPGVVQRGVPGPPYVLSEAAVARTDAVELKTPAGLLWSPGPVVAVDVDGPLTSDGDGALRTRRSATSYAVSSAALVPDPGAAGPGTQDPQFLQLPDTTPARVRALAEQITAGATTQFDKVRAVEDWLGANAAYQLDSPVPARGEDAVDRFLFVDKVGFCEQFAAAEAVLLRAVGVPTRFVTGLAYGVDAGADRRSYREKDLHTWVEVSYAGLGWVASDPTAEAAQAEAGGLSVRQRIAAALRAALVATESVPGGRRTIAAAVLALVVLVPAAAVLRRRRDRSSAGGAVEATGAPGGAGPALAAFLRLDRRLGADRRRPSESLAEMRRRLGLTGPPAAAFEVVAVECYGPGGPAGPAGPAGPDAPVDGDAIGELDRLRADARSG